MKNIFIALAFITISSTAFSQIKIRPGVRAGVNFANFTNSESDALTDLYIGGFAAFQFVNFYTLQPEITYSRQGAKSRFSGADNLEVQYIGLTLANKFSPFNEIGLNFMLGPVINIKAGDNINGSAEDFDFLIFGGLGYDFPFGLGLEVRYNIGIVDVLGRNVNADEFEDTDIDNLRLNKVLQIGATYKFDF